VWNSAQPKATVSTGFKSTTHRRLWTRHPGHDRRCCRVAVATGPPTVTAHVCRHLILPCVGVTRGLLLTLRLLPYALAPALYSLLPLTPSSPSPATTMPSHHCQSRAKALPRCPLHGPPSSSLSRRPPQPKKLFPPSWPSSASPTIDHHLWHTSGQANALTSFVVFRCSSMAQ
jgi:hypothetical protein